MITPPSIKLASVPHKPGVYQYRDAAGRLLYIGKAKDLRNRVSSYFHSSAQHTPSKQIMTNKIATVEYIITSSETEALLLEASLIKRYQPPYNIDLKDDKNFLYIKITTDEEFPRVFTVRHVTGDRAKYFGPYTSALAVRQTLHTLRQLFPHRNFPTTPNKRQLEYTVKRYPELMGPCDPREYRTTINRITQFLTGHYQDIIREVTQEMRRRSAKRQFERAAQLRDTIHAMQRMMEKQKVVSPKRENCDILSLARDANRAAVNLFSVRDGKLIAKQDFLLGNTGDQTDGHILQAFCERFYAAHTSLPPMLVVPVALPDAKLLTAAFGCRILVPQRGTKRQYLQLGQENAAHHLEQQRASWERDQRTLIGALDEFKKRLQLPSRPRRIEVYDISNIQGTHAVGSMVVFTDGKPDKQWYRKFTIKTVQGANDFAMLSEVLRRRFQHAPVSPGGGRAGMKGEWPKPDLIILDGGKGQLSAVTKQVPIDVPIVALAKQFEDIYRPGANTPLRFSPDTPAFFLLQRMRDEAHRFAITFYRKRHGTDTTASRLDSIPGIGPTLKKKLLTRFGSVEAIRTQPAAALAMVVGDSRARRIKELL